MTLDQMTKDEKSLLLYFEARAVDYGGKVNSVNMNQPDMAIAQRWSESGFVRFGRIVYADVDRTTTHWCELSDEAWQLAHAERRNRYQRMNERRTWRRTEEK
jgi:hypothetical protein